MASANTEEYYKNNFEYFKSLEVEAKYSIEAFLSDASIKVHSVFGRVKKFDSYVGKLKRFASSGKEGSDINDIVGLRVLCLFMSDVDRIGSLIRENFDVISADNKIKNQEVDTFGYLSDHYIVKLKKELRGPRYDSIKKFKFEIQVRTVAMDAWATISHYLDYKSDTDIPRELKKSFMALSGLFYVADVNFEQLFGESNKSKLDSKQAISKSHGNNLDLNLDTLKAFLEKRYPRRVTSDDSYSSLLKELDSLGMTSIGDLSSALDGTDKALAAYELDHPPWGDDEDDSANGYTTFSAVGATRMVLALSSQTYRDITERNHPEFLKVKFQRLLPKLKKKKS